jgi:hypothetical protein
MFYVYLWLRANGIPYYVGKGKKRRAFQIHDNIRPPATKDRILVEYHNTEQDAYAAEKFLISFYGRLDLGTGCLRNLTDGGDGPIGRKGKPHSEEWKKDISEKMRGRKFSSEHRAKISAAKTGLKQSEEHRQHNREARLGKKHSAETRVKFFSRKTRRPLSVNERMAASQRMQGNQNWRIREERRQAGEYA